MRNHITAGPRPTIPDRYRAIPMIGGRTIKPDLIVCLEVDHSRRGNDGQPEMWNAEFGGERIVFRDRDPEHAACRVLMAQGFTGLVLFVQKATGTPGAAMDVVVGAGITTSENDRGIRRRKYVPFSCREDAPARVRPSPGTNLPADQIASAGNETLTDDQRAAIANLKASVSKLDSLTGEERALLDGEVQS